MRSARKIEQACQEDVAFKMIAMLEMPDHATIARFVERHEAALAALSGQVPRTERRSKDVGTPRRRKTDARDPGAGADADADCVLPLTNSGGCYEPGEYCRDE